MKKVIFILIFVVSNILAKDIKIDIEQAISMALENNHLNKISKINLEIAQAQYEQALSANYPSLNAVLYANRDDTDTIFQQRGVFNLPASLVGAISALTPPGTPATTTISADIDTIAKGRDTVRGSLELNYAIYSGGKIEAIINQAKLNKEVAKTSIVRSENEVTFDVKKYYYGYVLTNELYKLVSKIHKNMDFSTTLAKDFLEHSSNLKINKTDYLNVKLTTSLLQSTLTKLDLNKQMLKSAMANLIGLNWDDEIEIEYKEDEILNQNISLQKMIERAYISNPDMNKINLAVQIKEEQISESQAANYPQVGLFGNINKTYNSYEYGYLNKDNENSWNIGIAVKMSLFDGFRTKNDILEKQLNKKVIEEQKILFEEALALQLKNEFLTSTIGYKQIKILKDSVDIAIENSELNLSGFQYEMVEAKDLIQSQLMETYVKADYLKNIHDYLLSLATIDKLVGDKINENF